MDDKHSSLTFPLNPKLLSLFFMEQPSHSGPCQGPLPTLTAHSGSFPPWIQLRSHPSLSFPLHLQGVIAAGRGSVGCDKSASIPLQPLLEFVTAEGHLSRL